MKYVHILRWIAETPWALLPSKLAVLRKTAAYFASGGVLSEEEIRERIGVPPVAGPTDAPYRLAGTVAILPLWGVLAHRAGLIYESSGGTSTERFAARFRQAVADPAVDAVLLDVDSPGGAVPGVEELASEIYRSRGQKPTVAIANAMAASAAYWVAAAAEELVVTPSGQVGSIGVYAAHEDLSGALEQAGVRVTLIAEGRYKTEGNPYEPLTEEARAAIQEHVSYYYDMFVDAVARGRGVKRSEVREGLGEGRLVTAKRAVQLGMADRVATMQETIDRLAGSRRRRASQAGEARPVPSAGLDLRRRRLKLAERGAR